MKRQMLRPLFLCLFVLVISACAAPAAASPSPSPTAALQPETRLPFEGLWVSATDFEPGSSQVLAITAQSLYWVRTGNWADVESMEGKAGGVHEEYYDILSYNLPANHITLLKRWVRNDGLFGGFDYPTCLLTYAITGDELRIAVGGESAFPA